MLIDIHADDYGLTDSTSHAILECINAGKLNSISIMPNMEGFVKGAQLWEEDLNAEISPKLSVHLNFMEGHCLSPLVTLPHLVDKKGFFCISWIDLVKYNFTPGIRKQVKRELKEEIKVQIQRVSDAYNIDVYSDLRLDSHQHTHMIPLVMEAIMEAVQEENWNLSYIRITKEAISPYLYAISMWGKHEFLNFIKVMVLNGFAFWDRKWFRIYGMEDMFLSGVFFSGKMSYARVQRIWPYLKKLAEKRNCGLELLFHPGTALQDELGEEFNHPGANEFYLSDGRQIEYEAVMRLDLS